MNAKIEFALIPNTAHEPYIKRDSYAASAVQLQ